MNEKIVYWNNLFKRKLCCPEQHFPAEDIFQEDKLQRNAGNDIVNIWTSDNIEQPKNSELFESTKDEECDNFEFTDPIDDLNKEFRDIDLTKTMHNPYYIW